MQLSKTGQEQVSKQFDSYCKEVLPNSLENIFKNVEGEKEKTIPLSDINLAQLKELHCHGTCG